MSAVRLWAAFAALVLGALFVWVAIISFGPEETVVPVVSVTAEQGAQRQDVASVLKSRTALQRWREASGPSPEAQAPAAAVGSGERLTFNKGGIPDAEQLVRTWHENQPEGGIVRQSENVVGISSLPYAESGTFEQPGGRTWRSSHNDQVRYGGGWIIFGAALALALFLLFRGRIRIHGGASGDTVERFNGFERANHWMTATAFILMGLTGLVLIYGKPLLMPVMGEAALAALARGSAWLHMAAAIPFVLGILAMIAIWLRDNIPSREDWVWLKRGGGFGSDTAEHPPARKFNAGQKLVFWVVVLGGLALLASGLALMFPFYWLGYDGMQLAQISHAVIALLMIAVILGHIYIGSVGMEGAFDAMWSGQVDSKWARSHHSIWYNRITKARQGKGGQQKAQPAE